MRRLVIIISAAVAGFVIILIAAGILVVRSPWFHQQVRSRILSEVEKATGGRAELGGFRFDWPTLTARLAPFVLHGKEKPGEPVFLQAASIEVGLKVISALEKKIDLALLVVDRPEVHVIVYPDGTTNIPSATLLSERSRIAEQLLKLKVQHFELRNGTAVVRGERVPFDVRGDNLVANFNYEPAGPAYRGHVSSRELHWEGFGIRPVAFDFDTDVVLNQDRLQIAKATVTTGQSRLDAAGVLENWTDPRLDISFDSNVLIADMASVVSLPMESTGAATVRGRGWITARDFSVDGQMTARGLAYRDRRIHVAGVGARGDFRVTPAGVLIPRFTAAALGGTFEGRIQVKDRFQMIEAEANTRNLELKTLAEAASFNQPVPWSGLVSGPVRLEGRRNAFRIQSTLDIARSPGAIPIDGHVQAAYDEHSRTLQLGDSVLSTPATKVRFSGTLGESMRANIETRDLTDLLPALRLASPAAPKELPVKLAGGTATANLTITGKLDAPAVSGHIALGRFEAQGRMFDHLAADINASAGELTARNLNLMEGGMQVTGGGSVQLHNWKPVDASAVSATLKVNGGDVRKLVQDISGTITATGTVSGTYGSPLADVKLVVEHPAAYGETFDRLSADAVVGETDIRVSSGAVRLGRGHAQFNGSYRRTAQNWKSGVLRFTASGSGFTLDQFEHVREYKTGLSAAVTFEAAGAAHVQNGNIDVDTLDGRLTLGGITRDVAPVGSLTATAKTQDGSLAAEVSGVIRGSAIRGSGKWKLEGDYPGRGEVEFTPLTFAALDEMIVRGPVQQELPFAGQLYGRGAITGSLKKPDSLRADISLPEIRVAANPAKPLPARNRGQDLVLRNTEPVRLIATLKAVDIQSARLAATDTSIEASGRVTYDAQSPWDVAVKGRVNLAILQMFNSDVRARGSATLDTTIRGPLLDPQINGRLALQGASLYLEDLPQGVDNANGLVTFDRNRANIQSLTAEIGGGQVGFGGFIGFGGGILLYRVQGTAENVRLRDPDGYSITVNAQMNLTGTSENGLVSGAVTVTRAAIEPRADLTGLFAQSTKPLPAPAASNEYLRGLNFDVRIESGPSLEVETALTRNLLAEVEMRLRGNAARPALAGDIRISQGEIQFFGNKYTINRADIRFVNPTKIEPVFDVDLQTKARGIAVNISFTGTLSKLNVTYRSDPPMQPSDIIALLAVGRDPMISAFAMSQGRSNLLETGATTLSQAVGAPVSGRLQRFFGVSRLKIDPSLIGVDNIPQARLTMEQQVSPDITLTYITNLSRTQEQLVQVQWDINRRWSAIAVREENGVFGVDFQYRKRFK